MPSLDHSKSISQSPLNSVMESAKTLVQIFGPRETARRLNLNANNVLYWCAKYGWKRAVAKPSQSESNRNSITPSESIKQAIESGDKRIATLRLGEYTRKAAEKAAKSKNPLAIARKVRDVAAVYSTLWPAETGSESFEVGLLVGKVEGFDAGESDQPGPVIDVEADNVNDPST